VRTFAIPKNLTPGRGWVGSTQAVVVGRVQPWSIFTYPIFYGDDVSEGNSTANNTRRTEEDFFDDEESKQRASLIGRGQISASVTYTIYTNNTADPQYLAALTFDNYNVSIPLNAETVSVQLVFSNWAFLSKENGLRFHFVIGAGSDGTATGDPVITEITGDNTTNPAGDNFVFFEVADIPIPNGIATVTLPQFGILTTNRGSGFPTEPGTNFTAHLVNGNEIEISSIIPNFQQVIYTFTVSYTYIPPPVPPKVFSSSSSLDLTPLWIVLGCVGGCCLLIIIIILIVAAIVGLVKYLRWREKTIENKFEKTERMMNEDL